MKPYTLMFAAWLLVLFMVALSFAYGRQALIVP